MSSLYSRSGFARIKSFNTDGSFDILTVVVTKSQSELNELHESRGLISPEFVQGIDRKGRKVRGMLLDWPLVGEDLFNCRPAARSATPPPPPRSIPPDILNHQFVDFLISTCRTLVRIADCPTLFRLARNEEDETTSFQPESGTFLKFMESRMGRDLELYGFMASVRGYEATLADFLMEVLFQFRGYRRDLYDELMPPFRHGSLEFVAEEYRESWMKLFEE